MKLKTTLAILIITFISITTQAQTKSTINKSDIVGNWDLVSVKDEKNAVIDEQWPFIAMQFDAKGEFTLITENANAKGKYELKDNNTIRLYDAITNGIKQPNEETLVLSKLTAVTLIIEMDMGTKKMWIEYKKN